jgi:hypothetical protein
MELMKMESLWCVYVLSHTASEIFVMLLLVTLEK